MSKKVGVIGSGQVANVLAAGFKKHGYDTMIGSRDVSKLEKARSSGIKVGSFEDTAAFGDIVVLAVKGSVAESLVKSLKDKLNNRIVIDTTNPIDAAPPVNGVLKFFTSLEDSLMERLQKAAPTAKFVKAFNSVGNAFMVDPVLPGGKPTMFICGNDDGAKKEVADILTQFGHEPEDFGKVESARAIEPLCMLWCIPGMLRNQWTHAFRLLKA